MPTSSSNNPDKSDRPPSRKNPESTRTATPKSSQDLPNRAPGNQPSNSTQRRSTSRRRSSTSRSEIHREQLFYRLRSALTRSLFAIAILGLAAGLIWYIFFFDSKKDQVAKDEDANALTNFEKTLVSDDVLELLELRRELDQDWFNQPLPVKVDRLKKKVDIGRKLEELHADESSYISGLDLQLESLVILNNLCVSHSLNNESINQELQDTANRLLDHPNDRIAQRAQLGLSLSALQKYVKDNSDENYETMEACFVQASQKAINNLTTAKSVQQLFILVNTSKNEDHVRRLKSKIGDIFKTSEVPEIWSTGAEIHDEMLLGAIDYQDLSRRILFGESSAVEELGESIDIVTSSEKVSVVPITKIISLVENLNQVGLDELEKKYVAKLRSATPEMKDAEDRTLLEQSFSDYEKRQALANQVFDMSVVAEGSPPNMAVINDKVVVMLFYSGYNSDSISYLERLKDLTYLNQQGVEFIAYCVDLQPNEQVQTGIAKGFSELLVLTRESAPGYFEQCPIAKVPYILLLDREHRVAAVNVNIDQLRTEVEELTR